VACNTASAAAFDALERCCPVPVVDVVRPGAAAALAEAEGPIGVIATEATISSGAYRQAIGAIDPGREVIEAACPLLVPIVEEGRDPDDPIVLHVLSDYLRELQRRRPKVLILGCTHYPLLRQSIAKLMGPSVRLVSSASAAAMEVQRRLAELGQRTSKLTKGRICCYTTDNPGRFAKLAPRFIGSQRAIDQIEFVGTDELVSQAQEPERLNIP